MVQEKPMWGIYGEITILCLDLGSVFVMLERISSLEYLFYHSLEPIPSTPRLTRIPIPTHRVPATNLHQPGFR